HDGSQAAPSGDSIAAFVPGMHGAGKTHEIFASRADGEDFYLTVLTVTNSVIGLLGVLPPEICGRFDLSTMLVHQEIDRLRRTPGNRDDFKPGTFLHGCEHTAKGAIEKQAGEGRFCTDKTARCPGNRGISRWTDGKDKHIVRGERIDARGQTLVEEPDGKAIATQISLGECLVKGFNMRLTVGQVHMQYASVISVHGVLRGSDTIAILCRRCDCRKGLTATQACFWSRGMKSVLSPRRVKSLPGKSGHR